MNEPVVTWKLTVKELQLIKAALEYLADGYMEKARPEIKGMEAPLDLVGYDPRRGVLLCRELSKKIDLQ